MLFGNQFEYLQLTQDQINQIQPDIPKIDNQQLAQVNQIKGTNNQFNQFDDQTIFRFLQATNFNIDQSTLNLKQYSELIQRQVSLQNQLDPLLQMGFIYIGPRDKQFKPTIIIEYDRIDLKNVPVDQIVECINKILLIVEQYMLNKSINRWNVIINADHFQVIQCPLQSISQIINGLSTLFPQRLNKCYIFKPSTSIKLIWSVLTCKKTTQNIILYLESLDQCTIDKIVILEDSKELIQQYYELEQKFGGSIPNYQQFYPPNGKQQRSFSQLFEKQSRNTVQTITYQVIDEENKRQSDKKSSQFQYFDKTIQIGQEQQEMKKIERVQQERQSRYQYEDIELRYNYLDEPPKFADFYRNQQSIKQSKYQNQSAQLIQFPQQQQQQYQQQQQQQQERMDSMQFPQQFSSHSFSNIYIKDESNSKQVRSSRKIINGKDDGYVACRLF